MSLQQIQRERRERKGFTFHDGGRKVAVKPLAFDSRDREQVETVLRALGYFDFSDWRNGARMKAQHPDRGNPSDSRHRETVPSMDSLTTGWHVMNWFARMDTENPARGAFFRLLGPDWAALPSDPWVVAHRILDCAFSVITVGNHRGWL